MTLWAVLLLGWLGGGGDSVDPRIGTETTLECSRGNVYPAVGVPFGMTGWTPQTSNEPLLYQYQSDTFYGLRATHSPAVWMGDYGTFSFMPVEQLSRHLGVRQAHFRHDQEEASPDRYAVLLDNGIRCEVSALSHAAALEFEFPRGGYLLLDSQGGGSAAVLERQGVRGYNARGRAPKNYPCFFVANFDRAPLDSGTWDGQGYYPDTEARRGEHVGAYWHFPAGRLSVRVGTSFLGVAQARANLRAESGPLSEVRQRARKAWTDALGRFHVDGGTEAQRRIFWTSLYRSLLLPRELSEQGRYRSPFDGKVHRGKMYTDSGLWDTYRAQMPLLALAYPERLREICAGLTACFEQTGWMPRWPSPGETNVMIGSHADAVLAEAFSKGIPISKPLAAAAAVRHSREAAPGPFAAREGVLPYSRLGFVPDEQVRHAVARSLEYAYDDYCAALLTGSPELAERSRSYRKSWDGRFFRGRHADGSWLQPFDPLAWGSPYLEGCAWQWLFAVPHDVPGLRGLMGGADAMATRLDELLAQPPEYHLGNYGEVAHEMREMQLVNMGQYTHNNEPVHHVLYLYAYCGQPWKTQKWVRHVLERLYTDRPDGYIGDEDTGQMSAWYVFSALGFYPVCPGQDLYVLGAPLFDRVQLGNLTVSREGEGPYVQSLSWRGQPWPRPWIRPSELKRGGELRFRMGEQPDPRWGADPSCWPPGGLEDLGKAL